MVQSPLGGFYHVGWEQMLEAYDDGFECFVELFAISEDFETLLEIRTDHEPRQRFDFSVSFDHLSRSRCRVVNFAFVKGDGRFHGFAEHFVGHGGEPSVRV